MPVARRGTPPTSQIKEHKSVLTSLSAWTDTGEEEDSAKKKQGYAKLTDQNGEEREPTFLERLQASTDPESDNFNILVGMVILANAVTIGLETEYGGDHFVLLENFFNLVFFTEMIFRIKAFGRTYFAEAWNLFDFTLVCFGTLDLWILPLLGSASIFHGASVMRMLRILRLMRILRVVRLFRMFQQLYLIMQAFNKAFQIVLLMGLLVMILDYVCAIMLTQAFGKNAAMWEGEDSVKVEQWFGGISQSMQTLFLIMTLTNWDDIAVTLVKVMPAPVVFSMFALYIMVTSYTMLSLITGIISESLITAQQEYRMRKEQKFQEKKKELQFELRDTLNQLLEDDKDQYGNVAPDDLKQGVRGDTDLLVKLANIAIHIDEPGLLSLVDKLANEDQTYVNIDYFVDKLTNLTNPASASSIMDLKYELSKMHNKMDLVLQKLSENKK